MVGDVLLLRYDNAACDLEPVLVRQAVGQAGDDPVVLAREEGVRRGERDVFVRPHVAGDGGARRVRGELAHEIHHRRCVLLPRASACGR